MMILRPIISVLAAGILTATIIACQAPNVSFDETQAERDIQTVLETQAMAWNRGDIKSFMTSYLNTPELRFASGGSIERGWTPTLERYLSRYPDRAAMGQLSFTDLEINVIDADDALVFGRWALERQSDRPNGLFTLHFKKQNGQWVIISDHTSSAG